MHIHSLKNIYDTLKINSYNLIQYSRINNKLIYFIDSYRNPIERKISSFFQNINEIKPDYKEISIDELIKFFNDTFFNYEEYHSINEILNVFNIDLFNSFDFNNKYNIKYHENMIFIKIRFKDVDNWQFILSKIFNKEIIIHNDNLTIDKDYNEYYSEFKKNYKIPKEHFDKIIEDREFNIYNSENEKKEYYNFWSNKIF